MIFALQHWKLILSGITVALLGFYILTLKGEVQHWQKEATNYEGLYRSEKLALAATVANFNSATAAAEAEDKAHALAVERKQTVINNERDASYESRLSDLRRRLDAERLHSGAPAADPGSGKGADLSQVPDAAGSADDVSTPDLEFNCAANAIQLDELQQWIRQQEASELSPDESPPG